MDIKTREFGKLPTGETVEEFALTNFHGLTLKLITYGATITELHVPDRRGEIADVVLGFHDLAGYLGNHPYFGCIAGRVSGRITGGKFTLDGRNYQLPLNDPPNHLHGGARGFDKRLWRANVVNPEGYAGVMLRYRSPDGEEGYPGNLEATVVYLLNDDNEVTICYDAVTDQPTPFSLTNHSYFNLAGEGSGTIENHWLQISSTEISQTSAQMTQLGVRLPVAGQANDFNRAQRLGDAIPGLLNSHGDNYLLAHPNRKLAAPVARLEDSTSGRVMEVVTTQDCLQLYTAAVLNGSLIGKSGRPYPKFGGVCLECQGYPDGMNHPEMGDILLRPGAEYLHTTVYRFKNK
jgi:aldose 1-epimerase